MSVPSTTDRARRHPEVAALVGVVAGIFSAIVKFGWEVPFPPRTPERNATNPPQQLLEQLGFSDHFAHTLVYFNGNAGYELHHSLRICHLLRRRVLRWR